MNTNFVTKLVGNMALFGVMLPKRKRQNRKKSICYGAWRPSVHTLLFIPSLSSKQSDALTPGGWKGKHPINISPGSRPVCAIHQCPTSPFAAIHYKYFQNTSLSARGSLITY